MGCCLSHENRATEKQSLALTQESLPCLSKSPPRPEEESVKEVLSETPKPDFKIHKDLLPGTEEKAEEEKRPTKNPTFLLTPPVPTPGSPDPTPPAPACSTPEEISDSLSVSLSESVSNTTLRDEEVHQWSGGQMRYRSQGQNGNYNVHGNNRAVTSGRSPLKRAVEPGTGQRRNPVQRRVENSGRRSRSPGNRGNVGRSPSGRRNGPSPGRVRMGQGSNESVRKVEESESEWQGPNESLENPLVSLECFIFL